MTMQQMSIFDCFDFSLEDRTDDDSLLIWAVSIGTGLEHGKEVVRTIMASTLPRRRKEVEVMAAYKVDGFSPRHKAFDFVYINKNWDELRVETYLHKDGHWVTRKYPWTRVLEVIEEQINGGLYL